MTVFHVTPIELGVILAIGFYGGIALGYFLRKVSVR